MKWVFKVFFLFLFSLHVQAQYKLLEMNPPKAKKYLQTQLARMDEVKKYKFKGYIGETDQALLAIRDIKSLPEAEQSKIKKIVDAENKDRTQIYKAIMVYNKLNSKEKTLFIKSAYDTYKATGSKDTYYFENKNWQKKQ